MEDWVNEELYSGWGQRFRVVDLLADERSEFQHIVVLQSETHGRVLLLDGCVQITEADEFVYQEMLVHVPLLAHGAASRVLIIGAGDGGVLRRVLQHNQVHAVTMVEIDSAVIRLSKKFLPGISGSAWDDPRTTLIIGDGIQYVAEVGPDTFDVIIVDSTDPVGVGAVLFTEEFYANCAKVLGPKGLIVSQCGVPFMQPNELRVTIGRQRGSFAHATTYLVAVPTYVGGLMALGFSSNTVGLDQIGVDEIRERASKAGLIGLTRFWTPEIQFAAFQLPPYVSALFR